MSMYTGAEVVRLLRQQRAEVTDALGAAENAEQHHRDTRRQLAAEYSAAIDDLGSSLLPALEPESVARAVQLTGYTPLQDAIAQRERERHTLTAELQQIEADPAFVHRELQLHPRTGTLIVRQSEIVGHRAPWAEVMDKSVHERLERLLETGYGTDDYNVPFWRLSYYSDWEAADEILARFPDKKNFGELRKEILEARATVATFDGALRDLQVQIAHGAAVERRHQELTEALRGLDERYLQTARTRTAQHLAAIEPKWVNPRLTHAPDIQLVYLRANGVAAKARYLDAMVEEHAGKLKEQLAPAVGKIDRDIAKFSRPKNLHAYWPREVIDQRVKSRRERFAKQQQKFESHYSTVYVYNDYSRGSAYPDFVWWYLMTDNRFHGSYIPEVASFEQSHPEWASHGPPSVRDEYDDSSAAAVIADQSRDESSSYSMDAS